MKYYIEATRVFSANVKRSYYIEVNDQEYESILENHSLLPDLTEDRGINVGENIDSNGDCDYWEVKKIEKTDFITVADKQMSLPTAHEVSVTLAEIEKAINQLTENPEIEKSDIQDYIVEKAEFILDDEIGYFNKIRQISLYLDYIEALKEEALKFQSHLKKQYQETFKTAIKVLGEDIDLKDGRKVYVGKQGGQQAVQAEVNDVRSSEVLKKFVEVKTEYKVDKKGLKAHLVANPQDATDDVFLVKKKDVVKILKPSVAKKKLA